MEALPHVGVEMGDVGDRSRRLAFNADDWAKPLGTAHHLVISRRVDGPDLRQQVRRIVAALGTGMAAGAAPAAGAPEGSEPGKE